MSHSIPTQFHSLIIKGVYNKKTDQDGWRIVGLWGDEAKGEGNRIGPTFPYTELEQCEKLVDELESKYGLPVPIDIIINHFQATQSILIFGNIHVVFIGFTNDAIKYDAIDAFWRSCNPIRINNNQGRPETVKQFLKRTGYTKLTLHAGKDPVFS